MNIDEYVGVCKQQRQGKSYAFLAERCETSADAPYRMKLADNISPDEVCVLVLTGTGGTMRGYNGMLKKADNFVRSNPELSSASVRVCVAVCDFGKYHDDEIARKALYWEVSWPDKLVELKKRVKEEYQEETFNPAYIHDIFNIAILPRISKNDGKQRLDIEEALKNIRRLPIVGHCHCGYTAMMLEKLMNDKMTELGYSNQEQKKLKSQLVVLAYNPDCPSVKSDLYFVSVVSSQDKHNEYNNYIREFLLMEPQDFGVCYLTKKWGRTLMCTQIDKAGVEGNPQRKYVQINLEEWFKNIDNPQTPERLGEHDFMGFVPVENMSKGALKLQKIANNVLKNVIKNSLQQDGGGFIPLPKIQNLAADNFKQKCEFAKAAIKGYQIEQRVLHYDRSKIDAYANMRRAIPRVRID